MCNEWKLIETAPKDGTKIIAIREGWYTKDEPFSPCVVHWDVVNGGWRTSPITRGDKNWPLTHWIPVPKNPVELKNG